MHDELVSIIKNVLHKNLIKAIESKDIKYLENQLGPIKWSSQFGWGEGCITCSVYGIKGVSSGDCSSHLAIEDLCNNLSKIQSEFNEDRCDWI